MLKMTKRGRIEGGGQLPVLSLLMAAIVAMAPCAFADEAAAAAAGVDLDFAYCESTGEQYIDTGILGNPGLRVVSAHQRSVSGADADFRRTPATSRWLERTGLAA